MCEHSLQHDEWPLNGTQMQHCEHTTTTNKHCFIWALVDEVFVVLPVVRSKSNHGVLVLPVLCEQHKSTEQTSCQSWQQTSWVKPCSPNIAITFEALFILKSPHFIHIFIRPCFHQVQVSCRVGVLLIRGAFGTCTAKQLLR